MKPEKKDPVMMGSAVVLTNGSLAEAKTAHGLIRGTQRFDITGVIDPEYAGQDAGMLLDGIHRNIPIFVDLEAYVAQMGENPDYAIIGVALVGGRLNEQWQALALDFLNKGVSIVSGMHMILGDITEFAQAAQKNHAEIIDIRKHRPYDQLHYWSGKIFDMKIPRIAVLGTDCALGKRTTSSLMVEACQAHKIDAYMIYTGQTGWLQGNPYGFILDSTINDFVSGEIEAAIVQCEQEAAPDLIIVEGQSALRNPLGPCGSEIIVSGNTKGVVLQHAAFREYVDGAEDSGCLIPDVETEIKLIRMYGATVIAIALNGSGSDTEALDEFSRNLEEKTGTPVVLPMNPSSQGMTKLIPIIRQFISEHAELPDTTCRKYHKELA